MAILFDDYITTMTNENTHISYWITDGSNNIKNSTMSGILYCATKLCYKLTSVEYI